MSNGPSGSMHAAMRALLDELESGGGIEDGVAFDELLDHTVTEGFESAENVAEDFYEDYRMLGRFEVLRAIVTEDAATFEQLVEETAAFVAEEEEE